MNKYKITIPVPSTAEEEKVWELLVKTFDLVPTGSDHRPAGIVRYFDPKPPYPEKDWSNPTAKRSEKRKSSGWTKEDIDKLKAKGRKRDKPF